MEFKTNEEKVKIGKIVTKLCLEKKIIENGVLSKLSFIERVSLIDGIISGLLEKGAWQEAVSQVYKDGVVKGLFVRDYSSFKKEIIETASKLKQPQELDEKTANTIIKHWSVDGICELVTKVEFEQEKDNHAYLALQEQIHVKATPEKKKQVHLALGERALKSGETYSAAKHFKASEDSERISEVYEQLLANVNAKNIGAILLLAQKDGEYKKNSEELTRIASAVIKKDASLLSSSGGPETSYESLAEFLYHSSLDLSAEQQNVLLNAVARKMIHGFNEALQHDQKLKTRWTAIRTQEALAQVSSDPANAYCSLRDLGYSGSELVTAAKNWVNTFTNEQYSGYNKHKNIQETIHRINPEHARAIYDDMPLEVKVAIAERLGDKEKMLTLSKEHIDLTNDKQSNKYDREQLITTAYHLWIKGKGQQDAQFVRKLREELINTKIAEMREEKNGYFSSGFLRYDDTEGKKEFFEATLQDFPKTAFETAQEYIKSPDYTIRARQKLFEVKEPEELLKYFARKADLIGFEQALDKFATQEGISKETLLPFVNMMLSKQIFL